MKILSLELDESKLKALEAKLQMLGYHRHKIILGLNPDMAVRDPGLFEYEINDSYQEAGFGRKTTVLGLKTYFVRIHHPGELTLSDVLP